MKLTDHDPQIVQALDRLEADLPAIVDRHMIDGVLDAAHFWPDFAGATDNTVEGSLALFQTPALPSTLGTPRFPSGVSGNSSRRSTPCT